MPVEIDDVNARAAVNRVATAGRGHNQLVSIMAGALKFMNEWKRIVPVKTHTYQRAIHFGNEQESDTSASVEVGAGITDPNYPAFLERGHEGVFVAHTLFADVRVYYGWVPAKPSMGPALDATRDAVVREAQETYKQLAGLNK